MSFFAVEAQTTKAKSKKAKKTTVSSASKAKAKQKAEYERIQKETDEKIEEYRLSSLQADSMRLDSERVAKETFELERKTYLENKAREQDSTNKANWKRISDEKEQWAKTEQGFDAVNRAAKLGDYQSRQVKTINQSYYEKAKLIGDSTGMDDEQRKQQLMALNTERKAKIKAVIGRSKVKKLEKERREYVKNNGEDAQAKWIDEAEGVEVKNK